MTFPTTHPALARALAARDYNVPTAVQLAVLEANAAGRDLLVSAQTGSGKTVAFGLAMATQLLGTEERFGRAAEPLALIIAPTRELALQVHRELAWLYAETGARVVTCVGGMDARAEGRALDQGAQIVVGTPGRLRDHLERRRLNLTQLKSIILDEADEMLDLGFREDLEFILKATPEARQTLLFSATMPREIEVLARTYQRDAVRIETLRRDEQHADIEYQAIRVVPGDTENAVVNVLRFHETRATLVFCSTREAVKRMHSRLVERGFSAVALSGELSQNERSQALQALRDGRARVLVATDVAARGLDLPDLTLVIHADLPNDRETLLHRSGRTGRAGKKGMCVIIVPFNRRRKAEMLLTAARLKVSWINAPTAEEIRARDQERFLSDPLFTDPPTEEEQSLVQKLSSARSHDEVALALVRMHRAQLPAPEDLAEDTGPPRREDRVRPMRDRADRPRESDRGPRESSFERRPPRAPRVDGREMVWFRLNIGRDRNADPRWLIPLICQAGNITKAEIGSIKIFDRDTRFEIVATLADEFADSARRNKSKEGHISRVGAHSAEDLAAVTETIDTVARPRPPRAERPVADQAERPARDTERPARDTERPARDTERPAQEEPRERPPFVRRDRPDRAEQRQDRAEQRPERSDRHARPSFERRERSDRAPPAGDRAERPDRSDRAARPSFERRERLDRTERGDRPERPLFERRPDRAASRPDRGDRPERGERPAAADGERRFKSRGFEGGARGRAEGRGEAEGPKAGFRPKAPWGDRNKADAGGKPHRKGPPSSGKGGFGGGKSSFGGPRSAAGAGAGAGAGEHASKPRSKYASKKKQRPSGPK